ncbi:MAG: adenylyl-sulfate kinase [Anaerolineaceae bacterium]|nr:adenylyl-sulfate kinase [Anaerolineaceae bacterium]
MLPLITILTGPSAAGKNTIAYTYAREFTQQCAVIDGDQVRWMYTHPHTAPWAGEEGLRQHQIGARHGAMLARSFNSLGLEVILLDVLWADLPAIYRSELKDLPLRIVRLLPTLEEALRRHHQRPPTISDDEVRWTYNHAVALTDFDLTLDTTDMPAELVAKWLSDTAKNR